ncbi:murein DD-endopeptidase MepM/ murein hydrolase activator NlpD [Marinimicrobium koreense]|uniref:Murein DD-endopeptidase MepM/ murein hydrolase activator NlpD n=1 Tax=Marinimicrobium koreense TaxID=306545 RepID=A0A3N1P085_9GAMM|nr:peptidoglycan DD-metalloendopeptidase family protein [Marinimicrobium koreense]ROQ18306.1 murein DD-endopeptidase MepM/ murein hydrolase activator NlpD [Marinimicrobium koreense]
MEPSENTNKKPIAALLRQYPRGHVIAAGSLVLGLSLLLAFSSSEGTSSSRQSQPIALKLPDTGQVLELEPASLEAQPPFEAAENSPQPQAPEPEPEPQTLTYTTFTVKSGDSLSVLFKRAGLSDRDLYELIDQAPEARALRRIMPGNEITFGLTPEGELEELVYQRDQLRSLRFARQDDAFASEELERTPDVQIAYRRATIDSSLFLAGQRAGMTDNLTMELAGIFGWDIDFILDIRRGDTFSVLFEEHFLDGEKIGNGPILAAEFTNRGKTFRAVRYVSAEGDANYFTPEGRSMRRAFLRTPVEFTRISSPFNPNRRHPVLNTIRAHKGTDYAAPRGTPVKASGDGRIKLAGRKGGYGNTVIIQHGQTYETLYAHLNAFHRNIRSGVRVKQGQIIGYVGSTGLATGPHLHYEFYVNGSVRNPVTVELPQAESVPSSELARFKSQVQPIMAELEQYHRETQLASVGNELRVN